jgi:hypothetical protein
MHAIIISLGGNPTKELSFKKVKVTPTIMG